MLKKITRVLILPMMVVLAACTGQDQQSAALPTSTLAPLVSLTPRFTATPLASRTPLPTFTPIPSETPIPPTPSNTPSPTVTPPIIGSIRSMQAVNIRVGPGTSFAAFRALNPGTAVQVVSQNPDGTWINIRMEDGEEGWISSSLLYIEATPTAFPTFTPPPDLTALALGTTLPTAVIGGGTVTPTPPAVAVTATPPGMPTQAAQEAAGPTESFLPIVDMNAINATSTALAALVQPFTPQVVPTSQPGTTQVSPAAPARTSTPATPQTTGQAQVQQNVNVFAMCDNPVFGIGAPANLAAGSTVVVFWAWYATERSLIDDHVNAVSYEVRLNDRLLSNWRQYGERVISVGNWWAKYWYVPAGQIEAGTHRITYRATWNQRISDGVQSFGPGTNITVEEGSCTFTVR